MASIFWREARLRAASWLRGGVVKRCPSCKRNIEGELENCPHCGCPNIGIEVPRCLKIRWKQAVLRVLLPSMFLFVLCLGFTTVVAWSDVLEIFGTSAQAKISAFNQYKTYKGYDRVRVFFQFEDQSGRVQYGKIDLSDKDYEDDSVLLQQVGSVVPIRYLEHFSYVSPEWTERGFWDFWPLLLGLFVSCLLPSLMLNQSYRRKEILRLGTVHKAKVVECFLGGGGRSRAWYISIAFMDASEKFNEKSAKSLPGKAAVGATLWALDLGTENGVAIFDEKYEWDCVRD
jgi:hypothetical protein